MGGILARLSPPAFVPERDMPDLSGKVAFVTGGNTGIGYQTVKALLQKNATVYLAARSPEKAAAAIQRLEAETPGKKPAVFLELDLSDLKSVRKAAEKFLAAESRLDILINNGGVMVPPTELLTAQGYDLQFGTNTIGHYFLTELLLPALSKSFEMNQVPARVIHTSSGGHPLAPGRGIEFESIEGGPERDAWVKKKGSLMGPWRLYGQSKLGNILVANHFAKKHSGVLVSCSAHPGEIKSELQRHSPSWMQFASNYVLYPTPMGALTQLWGATVATPAEITAQYLVPWGRVGKADKRAHDAKMEEEMIAFIQEHVKGF